MSISRRDFLATTAGGASLSAIGPNWLWAFRPRVENPLAAYPSRDWERIYRDQYRYDSKFDWVCSPNDTHACRVTAFVRNGTIVRMGSDYRYQHYSDVYGNKATANWNPRQCAKGYTFHRVVYAPYRLKYPLMRAGWKRWADDGFPYLTPELRKEYRFDSRGKDRLLRVEWKDAFRYLARAYEATARHYSGEKGAKRLLEEGYEPEMVEAMGGAGTRTLKFRGGMGLLGVLGKYGAYRLSNSMALLDQRIRGVGREEAKGGRSWSNYTWHGDQAPGHPWVHGLQTSDCDFNDLRSSKLIVMDGKNLVENKMTDAHWFIECMERGAKIVVIAPEYGGPSTKADYHVPIRPQTDAALFLGITKIKMDRGWYDADFVKRHTDMPLLVRTDDLRRLRANEVFPGYESGLSPDGPSMRVQHLDPERAKQIGDFVVWDERAGEMRAVTRDDVGGRMAARGISPTLDFRGEVEIDGKKVEVATLWSLYQVHLQDYDLDTVHAVTHTPVELIERLAEDLATITPAAIHQGEGINHWFHATDWKGGIPPVFDTKDYLAILAGIADAMSEETGDQRFRDYFRFELEGKREVYLQRLLDTSTTTTGYRLEDIMAGKFGPSGGALMMFRTYPRIPFWEQVHDDEPFLTDTGRLNAYADVPEAIACGENFVVHREGPEATPYLPNAILSTNPLVRPDDHGIPLDAEGWDERTIRNVKLGWKELAGTKNFLWEGGFQFMLLTPKTRHRVHSQWINVLWHEMFDSNFGTPWRVDKRTAGAGEHQMHINPAAARELGIEDGDYVWVDANPADRPYYGASPDDPFYKVARCMVRAVYNPAYPYHIVMMKHAPSIATERSVEAHETRPDGRALSEETGYQANFRYGSHQSLTRNWHMPMHQTDTLFHKSKAYTKFIFGGEADNHGVNTVPKEALVRITKAEDGGLGGKGVWRIATLGRSPGNENESMRRYMSGGFVEEA